jgi:putative zinc finger/helix-turn-helix YgiT family protein
MIERLPCSHCETTREVELVEREERVTIKGREVPFLAHFTRCLTCGEEFEAPGQLDVNLAAAREAYSRLYESPPPEALVSLRAKYNSSQKAFGMILGFGELTMNSYEQGGTPDPTNRLLLKLADDPCIFKAMYDINKSRIGAIQRQRIETSEGFQSALRWSSLGALSRSLTPLQQEKIEVCAESVERTVVEQVSAYVGAASLKDYSRIYSEAHWADVPPQKLSDGSALLRPTRGAA